MAWVVVGSIALAIGVTMTLLAIPKYNPIFSLLDIIGIILGVGGITIGLVIATVQQRQAGKIDKVVKRIREYSESTEALQTAQMKATLLEIHPLLQANRDRLQELHDTLAMKLDVTTRLKYLTDNLKPNSEIGKAITTTADKIIVSLTAFEPIIREELYDLVYDYAQRMANLGNPNPEEMMFTTVLLNDWIEECVDVVNGVGVFLPELRAATLGTQHDTA